MKAVGASIESGTNVTAKAEKLGSNILLVGIILQLVSYIIYVLLLVHTHWRLTKEEKIAPSSTVRRVIWTLYFSSLFILVTTIFPTCMQSLRLTYSILCADSWHLSRH